MFSIISRISIYMKRFILQIFFFLTDIRFKILNSPSQRPTEKSCNIYRQNRAMKWQTNRCWYFHLIRSDMLSRCFFLGWDICRCSKHSLHTVTQIDEIIFNTDDTNSLMCWLWSCFWSHYGNLIAKLYYKVYPTTKILAKYYLAGHLTTKRSKRTIIEMTRSEDESLYNWNMSKERKKTFCII